MVRKRRFVARVSVFLAIVIALVLAATALLQSEPSGERFALDDALPDGAVARIGSRLFGPVSEHSRVSACLAPDGARVFTVDKSAWLRAWDAERGAPLWRVRVQEPQPGPGASKLAKWVYRARRDLYDDDDQFRGIAASPDGKHVAVRIGSRIRVFDAAGGAFVAERRASKSRSGDSPPVWTADGSAMWYVEARAVTVWTLAGGARSVPADGDSTFVLGPGPDGGAVVATWEGTPPRHVVGRLSSDGEWMLARTITDGSSAASLLPDGRVVTHRLTSGNRSIVRLRVDLDTGATEEETPPRKGSSVYGHGGVRIDHSWGDAVNLVDAEGAAARPMARGGARAVTISADGRRAAVVDAARARLFAIPGGALLRPDDVLPDPEHFVAHPDGRRVFAAAADGRVLEIEIPSGRVLRTFDVGPGPCSRLLLSPDGRVLAGSTAGTFFVDVESGAVDSWKQSSGTGLVLSGGRVLVLGWTKGGDWALVDCVTEARVALTGTADATISDVRASPDGRVVSAVVGSLGATTTRVWDSATGAEIAVPVAAVLPPRLGATAARATEIDLGRPDWLGDRWNEPRRVLGVAEKIRLGQPRAFDVGEAVVALATDDGAIMIVSTADGRVVRRLRSDGDGAVLRLALVPGGRWLVSGHETGCLIVWDLGTAK